MPRVANAAQLDLFSAPADRTIHQPDPSRPISLIDQNEAPAMASGEKGKAKDIIEAIRTLKEIERDHRQATPKERQALARYSGFGPVALSIFPDPIKGTYKDGWKETGEELKSLLTPEEYDSAKRTTFNAFYTSSTVIRAMFDALHRLGVPDNALLLEPGMGPGRFPMLAPKDMRFIGVELDSISGRIAKVLHPGHDIRIENFRDSRLPPVDAVIGNVPFADVKLEYGGQKFSLHDFFFAKSVDSLKPGGVLALVTSRFTMDKQNAAIREFLAARTDFVGAIRLPSDAFKREGTAVVTDIVFLRKRAPGQEPNHADSEWLHVAPLTIEGADIPVNRYFVNHPEMVLGTYTRKDTLYGGEGYSVTSNGDLTGQLREAVGRLAQTHKPASETLKLDTRNTEPPRAFTPPPPFPHITEGSFFVRDDDRVICQIEGGQAVPVNYGGAIQSANGTMTGKRFAALIGLRDRARRVLQSQNEGWPEDARNDARRELNWAYDRFTSAYGPINKTTFSETKDGSVIRRMPNIVKFREDPDAMLVLSLEDYDEVTGKATKAAIMKQDVVGRKEPTTHVRSAEEGLLVSLNQRGVVDLAYISSLYGKPEQAIIAELGNLIYQDPSSKDWQTADQYLSGNVRVKLAQAEQAGPEFARNTEALRAVQPEDVLPSDIDANLGAPWIPVEYIQQFAAELFKVSNDDITIAHLPKDALWTVEPGWAARQSVAATTEYGTDRASGVTLFEQALNLKMPTIYDTVDYGDGETRVLNPEATQAAREKQRAIKEKFKSWIFTDPDRTERLVRIYNDTYNNLRPRLFDGSHLDFPGMNQAISLRQHQTDAIWRGMTSGNTLLAHVVGAGKAQPLDAKVLTPTGWARMGNLRVGDEVIAGDGTVTRVTGVFPQGMKAIWRVAFSDGTSTECCDEHLWLTHNYKERNWAGSAKRLNRSWECAKPKVRTTAEIRDTLISPHLGVKNHSIPIVGTVQFSAQDVPLDPYLVGALLGDGCLTTKVPTLSTLDDEILEHLCLPHNTELCLKNVSDRCQAWGFRMRKVRGYGANKTRNPVAQGLADLGLIGVRSPTKFVPASYKFNLPSVRLAVLQGLLDTDGTISKRGHSIYFYTVSPQLAEDVTFLVQSFGGVVRSRIKERPTYRHKGELRVGQPCHVLCISLPPEITPFRLARKAKLVKPKTSYVPRRYIVAVEAVGEREAQCISVSHPSHLYVTDDFIVTHNSYLMAATAMKMKQAGLIKKPMIVVPNHLLEQLAREFMTLYPNAKLLVATKEDLARDRRKLLTAKIASGEWDGIIITHSSFERIGMSRDYKEKFLREQIAEYDQLLLEHAAIKGSNRNLIKTIEKQKAAREEKLNDLLAEDKKDDGLVFDELGVDQLFVDELQAYKNLETPTKMDRVAGIQTGGSERAFDLYMKARYLHERHPGHGLIGATGTPISNSLVEMYTMQRYFDPTGLRDRGIDHFDAWAATFGEVVDAMEISPDGKSLKPRSRFAKFINLPELQQMFRAFADVQTAEMLNLPRPKLEGGKPHIAACPMSDEQDAVQQSLVERYERIRNGGVDPREDNALAITTDGRKLALDARMLDASAPDFPESKVNALVENVFRIWKETEPARRTQMIFCDMGVHPTSWGYSAYNEITEKLVARGIPRGEIAAIGDADSDAKKQALFERVRQGSVRVLLGSTQKMGTGTNVQKRLVALHHLDAPWKPAEVEQREGRILRQGNENPEVAIYRYVTEGSFDAYMWQALETKARFIGQIMTGENGLRQAEDVGSQELSYSEVKALASGNPAFLTLAESDAEIKRLALLRKGHLDEQYKARIAIRDLPGTIERLNDRMAKLTADGATVAAHAADRITIGGYRYAKDDAVGALAEKLHTLPQSPRSEQRIPLGQFRGLTFGIIIHPQFAPQVYLQGVTTRLAELKRDAAGPRAILNAAERIAGAYGGECERTQRDLAIAEGQLRDYQARLGRTFEHEDYLKKLTELRDGLKAGLAGQAENQEGPTVPELATQIKALRADHQVEPTVQRTEKRQVSAEEPVTAKIRRQAEERAGTPPTFRERITATVGRTLSP